MSYLWLSRYALIVCLLVWSVSLMLGGLFEFAAESLSLVSIASGLLLIPVAANALIAQLLNRPRQVKRAQNVRP